MGRHKLLVKALKQGLEEEGIRVDVVSGGPEGSCPTVPYDAIVLDLLGPTDAGLSVLDDWRQAGLNTPVLVLTAPDPTANGRTRAHEAAVDDWLAKPFGLDELLARLRAVAGSAVWGRTRTPGGACYAAFRIYGQSMIPATPLRRITPRAWDWES
jgi:DNA-binding response OmpR family regulator